MKVMLNRHNISRLFSFLCINICFVCFLIPHYSLSKELHTNDLIQEDSPYLLQHANNPVHWMPWNDKAFLKAKEENKLIFLSIGYSTCHWCHVMKKESFENQEIAKILNKYFISIKVDREEMPHVDQHYQEVHNFINQRSGGWPLTIVLTPKKEAFFAGTYLPIDSQYGLKGIKTILLELQSQYASNQQQVDKIASRIENSVKAQYQRKPNVKDLDANIIESFIQSIANNFDHTFHGIGNKPKFPHASTILTLLDIYRIYQDDRALILADKMLKAMANGGIYDQIEGGFFRYSVDEKWQVPHFEKMLYTNAELLSAYVKAYEITGNDLYIQVAQEIIHFVKERFEKDSLLFSASDADSAVISDGTTVKEEGRYFVFSSDEVHTYLMQLGYSESEIEEVLNYFNISFEGNFENGLSNPYITALNKPNNVQQIKKDLKTLRSKKPYPFIDEKILTSWNAMYISSLFQASKLHQSYIKDAKRHLDTLLKNVYVNEVLYHQKIAQKPLKRQALLEDYAFLIEALIHAYDFTFEKKYLKLAQKLNTEAINKFYKNSIWMMSDDTFKTPQNSSDKAYKSALSVMIDNLLKIAVLSDDFALQELAKKTLAENAYSLFQNPQSSAWLVRSYMAFNQEYMVLKAQKHKFENLKLPYFPFLLKKVDEQPLYLACKIGVCFAFSEDYSLIKEAIESQIKRHNFKD